MHKHPTKRAAIEKQARLEIMLAKVTDEFKAATFHENVLVADCLAKADAAMRQAPIICLTINSTNLRMFRTLPGF